MSGAYFQELEDMFRSGGIVIPLTYNDPGEGKNFVNGTVRYFSTIRLESCPDVHNS